MIYEVRLYATLHRTHYPTIGKTAGWAQGLVEAFIGPGIETNPPATNAAVQQSGRTFARSIHQFPAPAVNLGAMEAD